MAARWWRIYLAGGLVAIGGWWLLDGLARDLVYAAVDTSALVAILLAIRLWRPRPVAPWWMLAAGQAANVIGDVWYNLVNQHHAAPCQRPELAAAGQGGGAGLSAR